MVWAAISLSGHIDSHVFHGETLTGVRSLINTYTYVAAIGNNFNLIDDNVKLYRLVLDEDYLKAHVSEQTE